MTLLVKARSLLFVPADRPERYAKALASGADVICIDLEDALKPQAREEARKSVTDFLKSLGPAHRFGVRINHLSNLDGLRDVLSLHAAERSPAFVVMAKTQSAVEMQILAALLPGVPLIALIESIKGVEAANSIAQAHEQVHALMFGGADLSVQLGCDLAWEPLLHARSSLVMAAAINGLALFDMPWLNVQDLQGAEQEAARAAALGFSAKALIHPLNVAPVHAGLAPTAQALAQAQRILAQDGASQSAAQGVLTINGLMVDKPVVLAAQRLLRRAGI